MQAPLLGLDTGFFYQCALGVPEALRRYDALLQESPAEAAVSTITLFELIRHGYRGAIERRVAEQIVEEIQRAFVVAGVDPPAVVRRAAGLSHGCGLAMADALIAASLESVGCTQFITTDVDFERYEGPMQVERL